MAGRPESSDQPRHVGLGGLPWTEHFAEAKAKAGSLAVLSGIGTGEGAYRLHARGRALSRSESSLRHRPLFTSGVPKHSF
jgi:hypothetical protein